MVLIEDVDAMLLLVLVAWDCYMEVFSAACVADPWVLAW